MKPKNKIFVVLIVSMMFLSTLGIVNAFKIGDDPNLDEGILHFLKKPIFKVTYEQRRAQIALSDVGGLLGANASTRINSIGLFDEDFNLIGTYTDDGQYVYVNEGQFLNTILLSVNISTSLVDNQTDSLNRTRVYLMFMHEGDDPISQGYMTAEYVTQYSDDCYYVLFSGYVPYVFEAGNYIIYTEYDVRY